MKKLILFLALAVVASAAPPTMLDPVPAGYKRRMLLIDAGDVADTRPAGHSQATTWLMGLVTPGQSLGKMGSVGAYRYTTDELVEDTVDWPRLIENAGWQAGEDVRMKEAEMRSRLIDALHWKAVGDELATYPGLSQAQKDDLDPVIDARESAAKAEYDALWSELNP